MPSLVQRLVLPAALLTLLAPSIPAISATPQFFSEPRSVEYRDRAIRIRGQVPFASGENQDFLLAVPPAGELPLRFRTLRLQSQSDGSVVDVVKKPTHMLAENARKGITVQRLGSFRGVAVAHLRVTADRDFYFSGAPYRISDFEVEIGIEAAPASDDAGDSALDAGPYRELLDAALTAPGEAVRFATPASESPLPGPTEWQPRPENSPDFPWLRIPIAADGPVLIDAAWLTATGADSAALKPADLQLVADGKPVPILPEGDGKSFADGGTLIFYGRENPSDETRVRQYFLGRATGGAGARIDLVPILDRFAPPPEVKTGEREHVAEEDKEFQARLGAFLSIRNMAWVWSELPTSGTLTLPIHPPAIEANEPIRARLELFHAREQAGSSTTFTLTLGAHKLLNGRVPPVNAPTTDFEIPAAALADGGSELTIQTSTPSAPSARPGSGVWIDRLVLNYKGRYAAQDGRLEVSLPGDRAEKTLALEGFAGDAKLLALDLSNPELLFAIQDVTPTQVIIGAATTRLLVLDRAKLPPAPAATKPLWQDLVSTDHSADVLLIYHARFIDAVEEHASDLRDNGYEVETVDVESIYDAFSYGNLSTDAIRNFIAHAVFTWEGHRPHSVVLYGDANGDGRGIARNGVENLLPVRHIRSSNGSNNTEEFASDSWYTWLTKDDELADVLLARVSAIEPAEALAAVHHFIDYRRAQERPTAWANRLVSVSDTGDFSRTLDELGSTALAPGFENPKIYADDFPWEDNYYLPRAVLTNPEDAKVSPQTTAAIEAAFNEGAAAFLYLGHGAPNLWSNQRFWFGGGTPNSDILRLRNDGKLPFVTSFTCNNATIDYPLKPWNICIAEDFMRHEGKGAIGCFMPSGPGFVNQHQILARGFIHAWSAMGVRRQGVLAELARLNHQVRLRVDNHSRMYLMLGDPTLKIPPPAEKNTSPVSPAEGVVIERANPPSKPAAESLELLRHVVLAHDGITTATLPLQARLRSPDGSLAADVAVAAKVPPHGRVAVPVRLQAPKAGVYRLELETSGDPAVLFADRLPARRWREWVVIGSDPVGLVVVEGTAARRGATGTDATQVDFRLANLAAEERTGAVAWRLGSGAAEAATGEIPIQGFSPRSTQLVTATLPAGWKGEGLKLHTRILDAAEEPRKVLREADFDVAAAPDFDLAIVPESLKTEPEAPSDGLTIFVTGQVRNMGKEASREATIGLYRADDPAGQPLRDLTGASSRTVAPLAPGAEAEFRLRWDPSNNAGKQRLAVVVDKAGLLADRDPANQRAEVEVTVRTKCQLFTRGIEVRRGAPGSPVGLVARVGNSGETAAGPVAVLFYRSRQQTEANKIGETLLDGVPAQGAAEATFQWNPTRDQIEAPDFEPTFTIALRGSLQRVTSIGEAK